MSERSLQKGGPGEWIKAKSYDSFGPLGPWLVTTDEIPDPQKLELTLDLNGTRMQTGSTSTMVFSVAALLAYISQYMTLTPGDVITTGTPPGVGMARNPRVFLQAGDELRLSVSGLGEQRVMVVAEALLRAHTRGNDARGPCPCRSRVGRRRRWRRDIGLGGRDRLTQ